MAEQETFPLNERALLMRRDCMVMGLAAGGSTAHMGGSLSCIEIIASLYFDAMHFEEGLESKSADRVILSKGHGVLAQYAALRQLGIVSADELETFKAAHSRLTAHPAVRPEFGFDFATGSLGQGLSLGAGLAFALKKKEGKQQVFVILGDGECDEGSVWEAVMIASQWKLGNLTAIIDANGLQYDNRLADVVDLNPLDEKLSSFGWDVTQVDGHDPQALSEALRIRGGNRPHAVIADTVKGKGVSFMENDPGWHTGRVSKDVFEKAMAELEVS